MSRNTIIGIIAVVIIFIVGISIYIIPLIVSGQTSIFMNSVQTTTGNTWVWSARSGNGSRTRNLNLNLYDLENVTLTSSSFAGEIYLSLSQGENEKIINVSNFEGNIDMSDFVAGRISFKLEFHEVSDFNINLRW
ncbi:MAG: hypothetical protein FWF57_09675 [Defluviitaleaceae bacterium]|nr:hypothetical protein [Defluviitaleaceae bacterium]